MDVWKSAREGGAREEVKQKKREEKRRKRDKKKEGKKKRKRDYAFSGFHHESNIVGRDTYCSIHPFILSIHLFWVILTTWAPIRMDCFYPFIVLCVN